MKVVLSCTESTPGVWPKMFSRFSTATYSPCESLKMFFLRSMIFMLPSDCHSPMSPAVINSNIWQWTTVRHGKISRLLENFKGISDGKLNQVSFKTVINDLPGVNAQHKLLTKKGYESTSSLRHFLDCQWCWHGHVRSDTAGILERGWMIPVWNQPSTKTSFVRSSRL